MRYLCMIFECHELTAGSMHIRHPEALASCCISLITCLSHKSKRAKSCLVA